MKTKLLPTMIGAILAGGMTAAAADVTVFGHLDASVVGWDDDDAIGISDKSQHDTDSPDYDGSDVNFICTTCSIGFKGSEELGNGLSAIFKLDFQFDMFNRNSGGSITDRDQWAGLAGNFGQVTFGTMSTTYKSHGAMLDPGYRTVVQMRDVGIQSTLHSGAGEEGEGRADNSMRYDSPSWNGLKVAATYTLDSDETDGEDNDPYGAGVSYENGGILVFADYITNDGGEDDDAYKLGGKYTYNDFSVFGQYEWDGGLISSVTNETPVDNTVDGADVWMLGGSYTMGNNTVYAAYGQGDDASGTPEDEGYDSWEIVGYHAMSKRTLVYGGYVDISPDESDVDDASAWTLGMKHKF
jgi:predicted porin